jgi:predicted O-methyltransferase YrrM
MSLDPFEFKKHSKLHPLRLGFTAYARGIEAYAGIVFDKVQLELVEAMCEPVHDYDQDDTAVTPSQMGTIVHYGQETEHLKDTVIAEIGSYRGITTAQIAAATARPVYAVDPFIGYGGAETDYARFLKNTQHIATVTHLRQTSGAAARQMKGQRIGFLFIDAVHDYVNTSHDVRAWSRMVVPGGYVALHDTDNKAYAGTRLSAWQAAKSMRLVCHIPDLVVLQKI